jgi:hypothetical protein
VAIVNYFESSIFSQPVDQRFRLAPTTASGQPAFIVLTSGVPVAQLAAAANARYGSLEGFVRDEIMPDLERHGLYVREAYRVLWLIPATRWRLTPAGQEARAELQRLIALGDQRFSGWVDNNPGQALAYTALAGSALLLMTDSYPDIHRLHGGADPGTGYLNVDPVAFDSLSNSFSGPSVGSDAGAGGADLGGGNASFDSGDGGGGSE